MFRGTAWRWNLHVRGAAHIEEESSWAGMDQADATKVYADVERALDKRSEAELVKVLELTVPASLKNDPGIQQVLQDDAREVIQGPEGRHFRRAAATLVHGYPLPDGLKHQLAADAGEPVNRTRNLPNGVEHVFERPKHVLAQLLFEGSLEKGERSFSRRCRFCQDLIPLRKPDGTSVRADRTICLREECMRKAAAERKARSRK